MATATKPHYPAPRNISESARLKLQHDLVVQALGGLILAGLDTSQRNLRLLDVGTANGHFLASVRSQALRHPESATLIGTDLAPYPDSAAEGVELVMHDFRTPFPNEWNGSFDFVQLRACLANVPGTEAVGLVRRLLELVKPGGWIQLVDGTTGSRGWFEEGKPWTKIYSEVLGGFTRMHGLDTTIGERVGELLEEVGGMQIEEVGGKVGKARIGKGCGEEMREIGIEWVNGLYGTMMDSILKMDEPLLSEEGFEESRVAVLKQAEDEGIDVPWFAAWARKK